MQYYTIINAFKESGMWPPSAKAGIKKMRSYQRRKRGAIIEDIDNDNTLPPLPPTRPEEVWNTAATIRALGDRNPTQFSDPSIELFYKTMKAVDIQLQKSHLLTVEHASLQEKVRIEQSRKITSRRSINKGGPAARIEDLRERIRIRDETEKIESLRKLKKQLQQAINKAKNELKSQGV